jgi:DNA-binding transcriptional ArsR family regulator
MKDFIAATKALSDENRVRALFALSQGELCVCQIIEMLGLAPSTVSKHMSILRQAGLVESRKQDRWIYYRLPGPRETNRIAERMLRLCLEELPDCAPIAKDTRTLAAILKVSPETICRRQRRSA